MKFDYKKLGNLIEISETKNKDLTVTKLVGMNIHKEFIPSVANTIGTNLARYKLINENQFACNLMHVGRDKSVVISLFTSKKPTIISPAYKVFEIKNKEMILPKFLMMYFRRSEFDRLGWFYTDSSIRGSLDWAKFCDIKIPIPTLEIQEKIVKIYEFLNYRIKLKERINKNLEEQILTIFVSWFFKFDLNDEFKDSKLGLIPKDWSIDYLGSNKSCSIIGSGIPQFTGLKNYIATADVDNTSIVNENNFVTMKNKPSRANMSPTEKSIWFAKMIDSRKLIMVDDYSKDLIENYIFSTGFCGLKCLDKYFYYLWSFLLTNTFDTMKNNFCTGTTMQAINNKDTKMIEFVLPDDNTLFKFDKIAKPVFEKIYYNNLEIKKLTKLRDVLLPKLMSGD